MKKCIFNITLVSALFLTMVSTTWAQNQIAHIGIIVDASGSMNAQLDGKPRIDIAKSSINEIFTGLNAEIALWVFGHNFSNALADKAESCLDVERLTDFTTDLEKVKSLVMALTAKSWTPLAYSISEVGEYLSSIETEMKDQKMVLIVLSDGLDTCDGDPEAEAAKLRAMGIDVTIHVVGFAVDAEAKAALEKIALAGGGQYFTANNAGELTDSFEKIVEMEKVEAKEALDVISTSQADNVISGGSTFEDAVAFPRDLFGKEFSVANHLKVGAHETFSFEVKKDQILDTLMITGEKGLREVNGEVELSDKAGPHAAINFYSERKTLIDGVRTSSRPFEEFKDKVRFKEDGTVYMFIGPASNATYGSPNDIRYTLSFEGEDLMKAEEEAMVDSAGSGMTAGEETTVQEPSAVSMPEAVSKEVNGMEKNTDEATAMSMEQKLLYFGIPAVLLLVILAFVIGRKKKDNASSEGGSNM